MANIHSVLVRSARKAYAYLAHLPAPHHALRAERGAAYSVSRLTPVVHRKAAHVQERMRAFALAHPIARPRAWPALSILLIAPGIFTFEALVPPSSMVMHAAGLNLDVAYAPIVHLQQPTSISLSTMSVFGTKGHFSIRVGQKLSDNFTITNITPAPLAVHTSDRGEVSYSFSGGGRDAVTLTLVPKMLGRTAATLQYGLDPPIPFSITTAP